MITDQYDLNVTLLCRVVFELLKPEHVFLRMIKQERVRRTSSELCTYPLPKGANSNYYFYSYTILISFQAANRSCLVISRIIIRLIVNDECSECCTWLG